MVFLLFKLLFSHFLPVFLSSVNGFLFQPTPSPALQGSFTMQGNITQVEFPMRYRWIQGILNFLTRSFEINPAYGIFFLVAKKIKKRKAAKKLIEVEISPNPGKWRVPRVHVNILLRLKATKKWLHRKLRNFFWSEEDWCDILQHLSFSTKL